MALSAGTAFIDILPRTDKFAAVLLRGLRGPMNGVSSSLSKQLTIGLAAAGAIATGISVKMAADFEYTFAQIKALADVGTESISDMKDAVLDLAGAVPVGPQELADALYFIRSSGIGAADAMNVLEASAKGAGVGLGTTMELADLLTSALNAFKGTTISTTSVMDQLTEAVRLGKAEPDEMAQALGQVLPVAAQLGLTFDQVAASIAAVSLSGLSTQRAATGLRYLLSSIAKPSQEALGYFNSIGLTIQDVQNKIANKGFLPTLTEIANKFDLTSAAGKAAFQSIIGGARGGVVAMALVGKNAESVRDVFNKVANSAGTFESAWQDVAGTFNVQWKSLLATIEALAIRWGTALLPVLTETFHILNVMLKPVGLLLDLFLKLPEPIRDVAIVFALWKIASLIPGISKITSVVTGLSSSLKVAAADAAAVGESELASVFAQVGASATGAARAVGAFTASLLLNPVTLFAAALGTLAFAGFQVYKAFQEAHKVSDQFAADLASGAKTIPQIFSEDTAQVQQDFRFTGKGAPFSRGTGQFGTAGIDNSKAQEALDKYNQMLRDQAAAYGIVDTVQNKFIEGIDKAGGASLTTTDHVFRLYAGIKNLGVNLNYSDQAALASALSYGKLSDATDILQRNYNTALQALIKVQDEQNKLVDSMDNFDFAGISAGVTSAIGTSYGALHKAGEQAFIKDGFTFGDNFNKFVDGVMKKLSEFRDSITENLDFLGQTMGDVLSKSAPTAKDVLDAITSGTSKLKDFGSNLAEIADIAGGKGKALSQYLLSLGPDAAAAVQAVADAPKKVQQQIANAYADYGDALNRTTNNLMTKMVGSLHDIGEFLHKLVDPNYKLNLTGDNKRAKEAIQEAQDKANALVKRPYMVVATANANAAYTAIDRLHAKLLELVGHPYQIQLTAKATVTVSREAGGILPNAKGGLLGLHGGGITQKPVYQFGEGAYATFAGKGAEAVIPLNKRGLGILGKASMMGMAALSKNWDSGGGPSSVGPRTVRIVDSNLDLVMYGVLDDQDKLAKREGRMRR